MMNNTHTHTHRCTHAQTHIHARAWVTQDTVGEFFVSFCLCFYLISSEKKDEKVNCSSNGRNSRLMFVFHAECYVCVLCVVCVCGGGGGAHVRARVCVCVSEKDG